MSERNFDTFELDYEPLGGSGKIRIICRFPDGTSLTDKFDVTSSKARERFLDKLCEGRDGIDAEDAEVKLEEVAAEVATALADADVSDVSDDDGGDAELLVALGKQADLFHTPGGHDSEGYASIQVSGHRETWPIGSRAFKRWLSKIYYDRTKSVPKQNGLTDALNVLSGIAIHEGVEADIAVRMAEFDGRIYLDLADGEWRVVEVDPGGWRIKSSSDVPIRFIRKRGMLPLPAPEDGGTLDDLRPFVNMPGEDEWILYTACLVAYLRPRGPYPVLILNGEHGSAKSTTGRCSRALIDANQAPLRRPPRGDRDLMIAASNGWIVAYDNLSGISVALSDALCMLATGGGFGARQLYSDDEEKIFDAMRPVLLNGIDQVATRADLLDRSIPITLPVIPEEERRSEEEFWEEFESAKHLILGALLDAVSCAMRRLPSVELERHPRMADFARWAVAASPAMGWDAESFLNAYAANRRESDVLAVESSPIGRFLVELVEARGTWQGTAAALLRELGKLADEKTRMQKSWPSDPRAMGWAVKRIAPNLRAVGFEIETGTRGSSRKRERLIRISKPCTTTSETSETSENGPSGTEKADPCGRSADVSLDEVAEQRPTKNRPSGASEGVSDVSDVSDVPVQSFGGGEEEDQEEAKWTA